VISYHRSSEGLSYLIPFGARLLLAHLLLQRHIYFSDFGHMSQFDIIGEQYKKLPLLINSANVGGKTYIVTGGNTGLGLETTRHLVKADAAHVIISSRKISAGETAKAAIERTTGRRNVVQVWQLDLTSFASVKAFAAQASRLERIDALIENAGVMTDKFALVEGHETCMTVNAISPFLLAALLMPKLQETAQKFSTTPRIVMVGSALAFQATKELEKGGSENILANLNDAKVTDR
jgi:NADP-dependent 3-hydroxy acid dehydrogenase YdfG